MRIIDIAFLFSVPLGILPILVISQHNSTLVQDAQLMLQQMIMKVQSFCSKMFKSVLKFNNVLRYLSVLTVDGCNSDASAEHQSATEEVGGDKSDTAQDQSCH